MLDIVIARVLEFLGVNQGLVKKLGKFSTNGLY
jgi:hypothetical protein